MDLILAIFLLGIPAYCKCVSLDENVCSKETCKSLIKRQAELEDVIRQTLSILLSDQGIQFSEVTQKLKNNGIVNSFLYQNVDYDQDKLDDDGPTKDFSPRETSVTRNILNELNQALIDQQKNLGDLSYNFQRINITYSNLSTEIQILNQQFPHQMNFVNLELKRLENNITDVVTSLKNTNAALTAANESCHKTIQNMHGIIVNDPKFIQHKNLIKGNSDRVVKLQSDYFNLSRKLDLYNTSLQTLTIDSQNMNATLIAVNESCHKTIQNIHSSIINDPKYFQHETLIKGNSKRVAKLESDYNDLSRKLELYNNSVQTLTTDTQGFREEIVHQSRIHTNQLLTLSENVKDIQRQCKEVTLNQLSNVENRFNQLISFLTSLVKVGNESRIEHRYVLKQPSTFTSPNYPGSYLHNDHRVWILTTLRNRTITLNFTHFDIEPRFDYMMIYDPSCTSGTPNILAGRKDPFVYQSSGSLLFVSLTTDATYSRSGFEVQYSYN